MQTGPFALGMRRILASAPLASRILAALLGGYALGALTSVAALAFAASPHGPAQAILGGMMLGLLVHAGTAIWVFSARSAARAWAGLVLVALPLSIAAAWVLWRGATA